MRLKEDYIAANCCNPMPGDEIIGYYSYGNIIKVHKHGCPNLSKAESDRLVVLEWRDIIAPPEQKPGDDFGELDEIDFSIMEHHRQYGFDYSNKVASMLHLDRRAVFDSHGKLRDMGLLERVEPRMIQYRKNIVKGKWIKHRNHTYYDLTEKGRLYLEYYRNREKKD